MLIPTKDDKTSLEAPLLIVRQSGEDYIDDVIVIGNMWLTALDYLITADSQSNGRLS